MIARIAVASAVFSMDKPFDYRIPDSLTLQPGQRVRVPFGASNRRTEGIVLAVMPDGAERPDGPALKPVEAALDPEPLLSRAALHLAAFVRERYFCTFYDAVRAILPAGVWFQPRDRYTLAENAAWDDRWRNPAAQAVFQTLQTLGGAAEESALRAQFEAEALQRALQYLRQKKLVTCETSHRRRVNDKTERIAVLAVPAEEARRFAQSHQASAPVQAAAMELLATLGECACKELGYYAGATSATLRRLEKLELLTLREQEVLPPPPPAAAADPKPLLLTPQQQAAYDSLSARLQDASPGTALLYGVTGSGKTVAYLRLIDDCLAAGRGAIVLVPEIALTPQLLRQFSVRYGARVAVLHSALRISERYETWKRIRSGDADVVLGIALALFLFIFLPTLIVGLIKPLTQNLVLRNLSEGVVKIIILLAYMRLCCCVSDVKRLFSYHGAEHKTIFCYEHGKPLTVENVRTESRFHPRCGTSFLLVVVVVSILVNSVVTLTNSFARMGAHLLLLPVVVGISYEINLWCGRHDNWLSAALSAPGKWLQHMTTNEPDDSMIECAIRAMELVIPEEKGSDAW